jgi:hypothetical protein
MSHAIVEQVTSSKSEASGIHHMRIVIPVQDHISVNWCLTTR